MGSCEACASPLMPGAFFCGECGSSTRATLNLNAAQRTDTRELRLDESQLGIPRLPPPRLDIPTPRFADESGIVVPPTQSQSQSQSQLESLPEAPLQAFRLTFSNGDTISVASGGLLGRNPVAGPGESHEHLIIVTDADRTVSKTHLEFGMEQGEFWVADRFSGNGTTIFETGKPPRRLVAGRRYRIERGSRVGIGEQSFTLN